jgi:hypothetical protein
MDADASEVAAVMALVENKVYLTDSLADAQNAKVCKRGAWGEVRC